MSGYKINGERWINADFANYAVELFKFKMIDPQGAYYSFKETDGVVIIRLMRSASVQNRYRDIMVRFATKTATDETPYIQVYDPDKNKNGDFTYRIKAKDDGYAYFYAKGADKYDKISCQLLYAKYPAFIDFTGENLITLTEFKDSSDCLQYVTPKSGLDDGTISFNATYCQNSTDTKEHKLEFVYVNDRFRSLIGNVYLYTNAPVNTVLFTLSRGALGKPTVIYADVYSGYATSDYADSTLMRRVPFRVDTTGEVTCLQEISKPARICFNSAILQATDYNI